MSFRTLPPFPDMRSFLGYAAEKGAFKSISAPVSAYLEATEIHRRVIAEGGPVLQFENPVREDGSVYPYPLLTNVFGTRARVAAGLGLEEGDLRRFGEFLALLRSPTPPKSLGAFKDMLPVVRAGLAARPKIVSRPSSLRKVEPDLMQLPIQTCWPGDAGPLLSWGLVVTRLPGEDEPRDYNLGIYRMQLLGPDKLIMRWLPMRGGAAHFRAWQEINEPMPVAVVIGCDPATLLSAVMPAPQGIGELALSGVINGQRARLAPCKDIPLHVPASSEMVLEGYVQPGEALALEGPFGDHTGYYNDAAHYPVFHLTSMHVRDGAPYLSTFTGRAPDEPAVMGEAMTDVFAPLLTQAIPDILDVYLPPETCSYRVAILKVDKFQPGQARRAMLAFWSLLPQFQMTKYVIAVDKDIDIRSWADVMWAVATRADPERDLVVLERTPVDQLDFASPVVGLGGKLGIDATTKIGVETTRPYADRLKMPDDIISRVDNRWQEIFGSSRS